MNALFPTQQPLRVLPAPITVTEIIAPLREAAEESSSLLARSHLVQVNGREWSIPKFLLLGQRGGGLPIRIALFAGLDTGSTDTAVAVARLLLQCELSPSLARDYALFAYPAVNVEGLESQMKSLELLEHRYSVSPEDEDVRFFESELKTWAFDGLLSLRSNPDAKAFCGVVAGEVIGNEVVRPALEAVAHAFPSRATPLLRSSDKHSRFAGGVLGEFIEAPSSRPRPFEIEIYAPGLLPFEQRVTGLFLIVQEILRNYRRMISHAANL